MTQAHATPELVERLRDPDFKGSFQHLRPWTEIDALFEQAAAALEAQQARIAELEGELKAALREVGKHAREAGEAIGRLEMSEAAGIVEGWRERAAAAEALADRYEKALREIQDLPFSATPGRFSSDIARQALSSQGRREGGEG